MRRRAIPEPCLDASNHFLLGHSTIRKVMISVSEATLPHLYLWTVHGRCQLDPLHFVLWWFQI